MGLKCNPVRRDICLSSSSVMPLVRCCVSLKVSGASEVLISTLTVGLRAIQSSSSAVSAVRWRSSSRLVLPLVQRRRMVRRSLSVILAKALSTRLRRRWLSLARANAKVPGGTLQKWSIFTVPW
ncbi:hypothetical protein D3C79_750180 [compost metagenome]